jgi:hypothetical protein
MHIKQKLALWKAATFLKKSNRWFPSAVYGKYVTSVGRGHEMMETNAIPAMIAPLTLSLN